MRNAFASIVIVLAIYAPVGARTMSEQLLLERPAAVQGEVIVRDDRGGNIAGRLIGIHDDEPELETRGGPRWLNLSRVVRVTQPGDPVIDGIFRGMGLATALCVLTCERTDESIRGTAALGPQSASALCASAGY